MTTEKLHIVEQNERSYTIDNRRAKHARRVGGGVVGVLTVAALGVGTGYLRGEISSHTPADLPSVTIPQNGTFSEAVETYCHVSPTDLPNVMANVATNGHNNDIANANGRVSPGEKVYFDANDCDPASR